MGEAERMRASGTNVDDVEQTTLLLFEQAHGKKFIFQHSVADLTESYLCNTILSSKLGNCNLILYTLKSSQKTSIKWISITTYNVHSIKNQNESQ